LALVALPVLARRPLAAAGRRRAALLSVATGAGAGACLVASIVGEPVGLFQRAGLTLVDIWIVTMAVAILRDRLGGEAVASAQADEGVRR
ncbi:MAG: hypothetical protein ACRDZ3_14970, partial [Acidimicrobiia bacterium]